MSRLFWILVVAGACLFIGVLALVFHRKAIFLTMKKAWFFLRGRKNEMKQIRRDKRSGQQRMELKLKK